MLLREQIHPSIEVDERTFKRFLRFPPARPFEGSMAEAAAWARDWFAQNGKPWMVALQADESIRRLTANRWSPETELGVIVSSAGPEAEAHAGACFEADEPDRYYFLECYAAAVVVNVFGKDLDALVGLWYARPQKITNRRFRAQLIMNDAPGSTHPDSGRDDLRVVRTCLSAIYPHHVTADRTEPVPPFLT